VGYVSLTIRGGRRQSAAVAFLHPVRSRENLTVLTDTVAQRILFQGTRALGIEVLIDSPDVGRNLREHRLSFHQYRLRGGGSLNGAFKGLPLFRNALRYLLTRTGALATGAYDVGAFVRTRAGLDRPDAQILMAPYSLDFNAAKLSFEPYQNSHATLRA